MKAGVSVISSIGLVPLVNFLYIVEACITIYSMDANLKLSMNMKNGQGHYR